MTFAPPSSFGAAMFSVAVPSNPMATDVINGATGGPSGLCQRAVVYIFELQAPIVRMICTLDLLLRQVLESNNS